MNDVLDRNLRLLLTRAYVPVLPRPAFREELVRVLLTELDRRHAPRRRPAPILLAVAAGLLAIAGAAWWLAAGTSRTVPGDRATLVARGDVALREADAAWRPATANERLDGVDGLALTELATPAAAAVVARAAGGTVRVEPAGHVAFEQGTPRLLAGALVAEQGGPLPLRLITAHGTLLLDAGRLAATVGAPGVELFLREGRAHAALSSGDVPLEVGRAARLEPGGRLVLLGGDLADAGPRGGERTAVAAGPEAPAPRPDADAPAGAAPNTLNVTVRDALTDEPVAAGRLLLLRELVLNQPDEAEREEFDQGTDAGAPVRWSEPIPDGHYFVFAHAEGYALAHLGEVTFGPGGRDHELTARMVAGGEVRGYVVDARTGAPLPDAHVVSAHDTPAWGLPFHPRPGSMPWSPAEITTQNDGSFELAHLNPGEHVLQASAEGHAPRWIRVQVAEDGEPGVPLEIKLGPGGRVTGRVSDEDARPIVGASIVITAQERQGRDLMTYEHVLTEADGSYACADLPEGVLLVVLVPGSGVAGSFPKVQPAEVHAGRPAVVDFLGHATGTTLRGRITLASGAPFGVRNLGCFPREQADHDGAWKATTSLADGSFVFDDLQPGVHVVYSLDEAQNLSLVGEVEVPAVEQFEVVLVLGAGRLAGRVTEGATGAPAAALVTVEKLDEQGALFAGLVRTDADGVYALSDLPPARYRATAYPLAGALGFEDVPEVEVGAEDVTSLDFQLWPGTRGRIVVRDAAGAPLGGVLIEFEDEYGQHFAFDDSPLTDADGVYLVPGLRPGTYEVRARRAGWRTTRRSVEARVGHPLEVELVMEPEDPERPR